jgi:hypothetical protein
VLRVVVPVQVRHVVALGLHPPVLRHVVHCAGLQHVQLQVGYAAKGYNTSGAQIGMLVVSARSVVGWTHHPAELLITKHQGNTTPVFNRQRE